jgi:hypothetical protein
VDDGVEPVSDGQDGAIVKLLPDRLLDEAVGSEGDRGTQHLNGNKTLCL